MSDRAAVARGDRGFSLLELMIALIVLSVGVFAVGRLFPMGEQGQRQDRMQAAASYYVQEELERLGGLDWSDADLAVGRHPASGYTAVGPTSRWWRWYEVEVMEAPLSDLKKVTVSVTWAGANGRTVSVATYVRRGS